MNKPSQTFKGEIVWIPPYVAYHSMECWSKFWKQANAICTCPRYPNPDIGKPGRKIIGADK